MLKTILEVYLDLLGDIVYCTSG